MNEIADNVRKELLALQNMTERELKDKWFALYGKKAPNYNVPFLRRRLAYLNTLGKKRFDFINGNNYAYHSVLRISAHFF